MEYKKGHRWLLSIRPLDRQIKKERDLIEELYTCVGIQGISYDRVSVVTSPENKFEKIMAEIDEHKKKLTDLQVKKGELIIKINSRIESLGECPEGTILFQYYICGTRMEKISDDLGFALSYCYKLRRKGIEAL